MGRDLDPDVCDEFALEILSYSDMAEVVFSRRDCPEIHGYYYIGPFEDDVDLLVGPDYSVLLADSTLNKDTQIEAFLCGLRSDLTKRDPLG